jgi:FdhD protein
MRTPGHEDELAVGFLRTEGLIDGSEVVGTEVGDPLALNQPDDTVIVRLSRPFDDSAVAERHFVATRRAGSVARRRSTRSHCAAMRCRPGPVLSRAVLLALPDLLRAAQRAFDETGGLHAAALFSPSGELIAIREDVGRHNALTSSSGRSCSTGSCHSTAGP